MQKITPFLWFDNNAEEAMEFYVSIFRNSKVVNVSRVGEGAPGPRGGIVVATFVINGVEIMALNGGSYFKLTPAFSLHVACDTQAEIDELWDKLLSGGGEPSRCGWLTDRFGLSWQIVPAILDKLMADKDRAKSDRVREAMLQMVKLDIAALERAHKG
ncbi:MAG TPA: VOC family protein [Rhizomicrobium sp.]|nr:VOC family protein [Rhizomicrobium sp.]